MEIYLQSLISLKRSALFCQTNTHLFNSPLTSELYYKAWLYCISSLDAGLSFLIYVIHTVDVWHSEFVRLSHLISSEELKLLGTEMSFYVLSAGASVLAPALVKLNTF